MQYWMTFIEKNETVCSISDVTFMGRPLNIRELKDRFNNDFIKGTADAVKISFLCPVYKINKSFIAGFRMNGIVICDMDTKQEYDLRTFNEEINKLEQFLGIWEQNNVPEIMSLEC